MEMLPAPVEVTEVTEVTVSLTRSDTPDRYTWQAIYRDGTVIGEFDMAEGRGWAEVDSTQVAHLTLSETASGAVRYVVRLPAEATPVFFRRRCIDLSVETGEQIGGRQTVHCLGWQVSQGQGSFLFVFEDGSSLLSSDLQAV